MGEKEIKFLEIQIGQINWVQARRMFKKEKKRKENEEKLVSRIYEESCDERILNRCWVEIEGNSCLFRCSSWRNNAAKILREDPTTDPTFSFCIHLRWVPHSIPIFISLEFSWERWLSASWSIRCFFIASPVYYCKVLTRPILGMYIYFWTNNKLS